VQFLFYGHAPATAIPNSTVPASQLEVEVPQEIFVQVKAKVWLG
jgi:hypothetical protein